MIDEILLDGKRYVSVKRAADLTEYTTDYVGQLCRARKIDATRVGHNWYIEENSIIEHKQSQLEVKEVDNTDKITLGEKRYVSVKKAAALAGYTTDYVGQLCRSGKLDATRIGHNWYVEESSLGERKPFSLKPIESKYNKAEKTKENKIGQNRNIFKSPFVIYSKDERSLLPELEEKILQTEQIPTGVEEHESVPAPSPILTKIGQNTEENTRKTTNPLTSFKKAITFSLTFAVFATLFSLSTQHDPYFLENKAKNLTGRALNSPFAQTISEELLVPFELVAKEINALVDDATYSFLYENVLQGE